MGKATTVLSKKKNLSIVQFDRCGHISLNYNNILLNFSPQSFLEFTSAFQRVNFDERATQFPDGTSRLVMHTRSAEIQFCFDHPEYMTVAEALREASVMLEVHSILNT